MRVNQRRGYSLLESTLVTALFMVGLGISIPVAGEGYRLILARFAARGEATGLLQHLAAAGLALLIGLLVLILPYVGLAAVVYGGRIGAGIWRQFGQALSDLQACWRERG